MIDVAIGVDVGGTKALALLVARDGRVLGEAQAPTPHLLSDHVGTPTAEVVTTLIRDLSERQGLDPSTLPVCIGLPGMLRRDGRLVYAPNLRSASGADLERPARRVAG